MTKRIAVYVAGDGHIFFPGLVALHSVQKHNASNPFDYFMCFDGLDLTSEMSDLLDKYGIHFIDTAKLRPHGSVEGLPAMREKRWPTDVFYNWILPGWLHEHNYELALKLDYDLVCVGAYYLPDLMPKTETVSGLVFDNVDLIREGVTTKALNKLGIPIVDGKARIPYYNAGVVGINVKQYTANGTFALFRHAYQVLHEDGATVVNAEQAALAAVVFHDAAGIKGIPGSYNHRITTLPPLDDEGRPVIQNIHYLTANKPWLPPDYRHLHHYVKNGRTSVYIYRDIWHEYARQVEGYSTYVPNHSPSTAQQLAMYTTILSAYHA